MMKILHDFRTGKPILLSDEFDKISSIAECDAEGEVKGPSRIIMEKGASCYFVKETVEEIALLFKPFEPESDLEERLTAEITKLKADNDKLWKIIESVEIWKCEKCGYSDVPDGFDILGADEGNCFCNRCSKEIQIRALKKGE